MVDYDKLTETKSTFVELPIQYVDFHIPRESLTHRGRLRIPYSKLVFDHYIESIDKREKIGIWNYAANRWTELLVSNIHYDLKANEIVLDLKEEI